VCIKFVTWNKSTHGQKNIKLFLFVEANETRNVSYSRSAFEADRPRLPSWDSSHVVPPRFCNFLYHRWAASASEMSHLFSRHVTIRCSSLWTSDYFSRKLLSLAYNWQLRYFLPSELGIATSPLGEERNTWIVAPLWYILPPILTESRCISHCALISKSISKRVTTQSMWTDLGWLQVRYRQ